MKEFRIRATGAVVTEDAYRALHPNVSFPAVFTPTDADEIHQNAPPAVGPYADVVRDGLTLNTSGQWEYVYLVIPWPQSAIDHAKAVDAGAARQAAQVQRAKAVNALTVKTAAGHVFDGDEISQTRMARAIIALQAMGTASVTWVLADNTVIDATPRELTEALALAGAAQAALWVIK